MNDAKVYISINAHLIRRNAVAGTRDAPIRVATGKNDRKPIYARGVIIDGPSELVYQPDSPLLKCGARLVLIAKAKHVTVKL